MDQIDVLKTIQLPESITGGLKDKFDAIDANFNALGSSTYTAGKDGVTRVHTLKFNGGQVENEDEFEKWLTSQLGISEPEKVVDSITKAFKNYNKDNKVWYANSSYEIYIGTDGTIKEALPILYANDKNISYLGFEYEDSSLNLKPKKDVLGIDKGGYWIINGVKTDIKAKGVAGENGKDGFAAEFAFVTVEHANIKARGVEPFIKDNDNNIKDKNGNLVDEDGNRIDENRVNILVPILKIVQYWDYTIPNNTPMSFDKDLDAKGKDDWFDKNKNRIFLFTYNDGTKTKTYIGYVTKYTNEFNSNIPVNKPIYGFYYSDNTVYSPGVEGISSSALIVALDNMFYDQTISGKPRGIWLRKFEHENDKEAIFIYNDKGILNISKIDNYTQAYNTGPITTKSTTIKVNGSFECDSATINNGATINNKTILNGDTTISNVAISNATISNATISNNLSVGNNIITSTIECNKESSNHGVLKFDGSNLDFRKNYGNFIYEIENPEIGQPNKESKTQLDLAGLYTYTSNESNVDLELYHGNKYLRIGRTWPTYDENDETKIVGYIDRSTIITPTKITSSNLKLIGGATINGSISTADGSFVVDSSNLIYGTTYRDEENNLNRVGHQRVSIYKINDDNSLGLKSGDRYISVESNHNDKWKNVGVYPGMITIGAGKKFTKIIANDTNDETPEAIIYGNVKIEGILQANSIATGESTGEGTSTTNLNDLKVTGSTNLNDLKVTRSTDLNDLKVTGSTNFKDLTVTGSTNLNDLKVINDASNLPSSTYIDNGIFDYSKLVYDVLYKLGIINSTTSPYRLNIDEKVYQTNYCNLYIKSCDEASFYGYNGSVYSVGVDGSNDNHVGNRYKITGYIMLDNSNSNRLSFDNVTPNTDYGGYNIFNPHDNIAIPQMIYIDDYFAFVYSNNNHIIITPYGILESKFVPHHKSMGSSTNAYSYDLADMYSTTGGNIANTSRSKQSVVHTLGNDLKFKLIYKIPQNS